MNSFYLTLPSNTFNVSENKMSNYTTYLPAPLNLSEHYEVALTEITYTNSWCNIQNHPYFTLYSPMEKISSQKVEKIRPSYYSSIKDLVRLINSSIQDAFDAENITLPVLVYDEISQSLVMKEGRYTPEGATSGIPVLVHLGYELEAMLGFETWTQEDSKANVQVFMLPKLDNNSFKPKIANGVDMNAGIHSLLVYSDIVSPSIVGNMYANLLRSIPVSSHVKHGEDVKMTFNKPYYRPLSTTQIDRIKINIKDDAGYDMDFRFGRVSVTLHFRKKWKAII